MHIVLICLEEHCFLSVIIPTQNNNTEDNNKPVMPLNWKLWNPMGRKPSVSGDESCGNCVCICKIQVKLEVKDD